MQNIKIIKTLPHLHPLFQKDGIIIASSNNYSLSLFEFIDSLSIFKKADLKFSGMLNWISQFSNRNDSEILDEYRIGEKIEYSRVESVGSVLEFSIKGDVITIWIVGYAHPLKLEFFGEDCEKVTLIDEINGKKILELEQIVIGNVLPNDRSEIYDVEILNSDVKEARLEKIIFTNKAIENINKLHSNASLLDTDMSFPQLFFSKIGLLQKEIDRLKDLGYKTYLSTKHKNIIPDELKKHQIDSSISIFDTVVTKAQLESLPAGFISQHEKIAFYTDRELFGSIFLTKIKDKTVNDSTIKKLLRKFEGEISLGDYVVHEDYGIAQYEGLTREEAEGLMSDYLLLKFDGDDQVYVPLTQINKITKYLGNDGIPPVLTKLGKGQWQIMKSKVKASVLLTAKELLEHYAKRELSKAKSVDKEDSKEYEKFVNEFEFVETKDQITAINEINSDLEKSTPMNRLLVGDVGFGKTEVLMRAAFKIIESGGQVAVLAPTTILTAQHFVVFKSRFKKFKYKIGYLSRFNTSAENAKVVELANEGKLDILIGTHRLLSSDVKFKKLELLIVDEEQKFGVKQKEKIKKINYGVHVLSISATPIPRTLSLALSSIQDVSIITTAPIGRKSVDTEIIYEDWNKAVSAIEREYKRGGQVYFVHNEVKTIKAIFQKLQLYLPGISFEIAHGQMSGNELDRIMTSFYHKKFTCLVCTSIIENGLDIKSTNTVIIHNAHKFGISQLYQIRGRVGRSDAKAYCLLMCPKPDTTLKTLHDSIGTDDDETNLASFIHINADAKSKKIIKKKINSNKIYLERLQTLVDNQELGSGFKLASKDLEIRGAGNILGEKQHGHILSVGYALYIEMLADAVEQLRHISS